jgi:phenylacetate-CoA ligase
MQVSYGETLKKLVGDLERISRLPAARLEALQLAHLDKLARLAHERAPFWRRRLEASGWTPAQPFDRAALERLPPLTRQDIQEHGEAMYSRPYEAGWGPRRSISTSGSTGRPVTIQFAASQAYWYDAVTVTNHLWHGRDVRHKLAVIRNSIKRTSRLPSWGPPVSRMFKTGPAAALNTASSDIGTELDWLREEAPDYLLTQPGRVLGLARLALERGGHAPALRQVITMGETVTPETRTAVRAAFGAEVKDIYSSKDTGYLALQCPLHEHYHALSGLALIEIVDDEGRPAPIGRPGRVLVTVLRSVAMPLIRYELGDVATWGGPCDCGRTLPVLAHLAGRHRNLARMPDGALRHVQFQGAQILKLAPVREYRITQRGVALAEIEVESAAALSAGQKESIAGVIQRAFGHPIEVRVSEVERIDWGPSAKREEFVRVD